MEAASYREVSMLIRAIQVKRFADPVAEALGMASRRLGCAINDLTAGLLDNGDVEVTKTDLAAGAKLWVRHKASGKYLTTIGLVSSLKFGNGKIAGYYTERAARMALNSQASLLGIVWDDLETVTCGG